MCISGVCLWCVSLVCISFVIVWCVSPLGVSLWGVSLWGVSLWGVSLWGVSLWCVSLWVCLFGVCHFGGMCFDSLLIKSKGELWPAMVLTFCHFSDFWAFLVFFSVRRFALKCEGQILTQRFEMNHLVKDCDFGSILIR